MQFLDRLAHFEFLDLSSTRGVSPLPLPRGLHAMASVTTRGATEQCLDNFHAGARRRLALRRCHRRLLASTLVDLLLRTNKLLTNNASCLKDRRASRDRATLGGSRARETVKPPGDSRCSKLARAQTLLVHSFCCVWLRNELPRQIPLQHACLLAASFENHDVGLAIETPSHRPR